MRGMLSPSVMCADLLNLSDEIKKLDNLGVEYLHIDFMDNKFVPNITFDTNMIKSFKKPMKNIKRDIHIMASHKVLADIKSRGADPCIAISPDTPVEVVNDFLDEVYAVLLMTVYPGFAGQPMAPKSMERLSQLKEIVDKSGKDVLIEVDGHVSWEHCGQMRQNGADIFVAGSSSVYGKDYPLDEAVAKFYELVM